jgi:LysM repeat protein
VKLGVVAPEYKKLEHVVQSGETLSHIARAYKLSLAELRALNNLKGHLIRKGQKLTVRQPVAVKGVEQPVRVPARRLPPSAVMKRPFAAGSRR